MLAIPILTIRQRKEPKKWMALKSVLRSVKVLLLKYKLVGRSVENFGSWFNGYKLMGINCLMGLGAILDGSLGFLELIGTHIGRNFGTEKEGRDFVKSFPHPAPGPGLPVKFTAAAKGQSFPHPAPGLPVPPSVIKDLSTRLGNLEVIGPRVSAIEGQVQVMVSQMVYVADRWEQVGAQVEQGQQTTTQRDEVITGLTQYVQALQAAVQQRDSRIQQPQTMVSEMSSRESTLMQCILGMDRRLADLERRPPGPQ
ncbi:hypothetical protein Tco_0311428 [Tanacetum coccineum]